MPDEASTPPPDTQAPPSEPVSAPVIEPTPPPEAAAPAPEPTQTETPAPSSVQDYGRAQQAQPEPTPEPEQPKPQSTANTNILPHGDPEEQRAVNMARLVVANAKIQATKQKRLDKIMSRLSEKGKITNDEVEKLLRVSDATATRYLDALEKEGRVRQEGKTGTGVLYVKI
ncbi:MAG: hypothetical protein COV91_01430 [Candidatus Taylorbacteria bacterium CG11_big_fil_rev_8_21_14_0_20_46_11]|uniref:Uncharacterized protein n=1 Tax=Candidatus Taylorbacteria bacterium CG11_big_fil_rev_8_21_14_0_20_46_11 TaxID=1975025 RepID=A0A2H0KCH8_9BACT|nr:MAG: hypothetical protein COV91_01430 [Candidatus Taylorbacteria bacterium CG11_big_fil_rev_8_21_14_0_20_46_11]